MIRAKNYYFIIFFVLEERYLMVRRKSNAEIKNVAHRARWQPEDDLKLGVFFDNFKKKLDL